MTSKREFVDYLRDMLDAIEKIERFTRGMTDEQYNAAVLKSQQTTDVEAEIKRLEEQVRSGNATK